MKGVIVKCLEELAKEKFGLHKWEKVLAKAGINKNTVFLATSDIDDNCVIKLIKSLCEELNLSLPDIADLFGDYWVNIFAPKIYGIYYKDQKSAKEFLINMDSVHEETTRSMPNAHPPRFEYDWKDKNTMILSYKSKRGLIDLMIGLVKGVGKYYDEDLQINKISEDKLEIVFPN